MNYYNQCYRQSTPDQGRKLNICTKFLRYLMMYVNIVDIRVRFPHNVALW